MNRIPEKNFSEDAAPDDPEVIIAFRAEDVCEEQAGSTNLAGVDGLGPSKGKYYTLILEHPQLTAG